MKWEPYTADEGDYIPPTDWGKDHWSTFVYLQTRVVDHGGIVNNQNMRTHPRLHRHLVGLTFGHMQDGSAYPTRLANGNTRAKHDDWSCLEDMVNAGMLKAYTRVKDRNAVFGGTEARVELTTYGVSTYALILSHKAAGGAFATFRLGYQIVVTP